MKKTYFLSGAAILLLLASSCEKENTDSLNPSQFQKPGSLLSSPIFNVTFGGSKDAFGRSATKSNDGAYLIAGATNSDDEDVSGNHGMYDGWLMKIDRYGNKLWQKTYGGTNSDAFHSIASTTDGGYIVAGETESSDGDVSGYAGNVGVQDFWVVKTDASGNIAWSKAFGSGQREIASSVMETTDGNYVIVGKRDVSGYVIKLDKNGDLLWEKILNEGSFFNEFTSVLEDSDGNYIATGFANRRGYRNDFWLVKLNKNGDVVIHRQYGGLASENAFSATLAQDGAYILAGQRENLDENTSDIMVIKVNKEGTCLWERVYKTPDVESESRIITLADGGFLIVKNTNLDIFTLFGSWMKLDDKGNKLEEQKLAEKITLSFLITGLDNNFITGGWQRENSDAPTDMLAIGFQLP